jgi:hypothetical protein
VGRRRSGAAGHAGNLHAKVLGDPVDHGSDYKPVIHIRGANIETDRADGSHIGSSGSVRHLDDSVAFRIRPELPDRKVPAVAEQDHGDGCDCGRGSGSAHFLQLAVDAEARVGSGGCGGGAQHIVVVHCAGTAALYLQRELWSRLVWLLLESVSEYLGIR